MAIQRIKHYRLGCDHDLTDTSGLIKRCRGTIDVKAFDKDEAVYVSELLGWTQTGSYLKCPAKNHSW